MIRVPMPNFVCVLNSLFPGEQATYAFKVKYWPQTRVMNTEMQHGCNFNFCVCGSKSETHQVNKAADKALQSYPVPGNLYRGNISSYRTT